MKVAVLSLTPHPPQLLPPLSCCTFPSPTWGLLDHHDLDVPHTCQTCLCITVWNLLLCLLLIPSLLSRPRLKAISVEAFSDHSALYGCTPPSLPLTPLSVSLEHLQSCDHDPFTHLFPVCPPATRISTAWGQGFFCFVHSYIPSTKNRSGAPWIFVEPWFVYQFFHHKIDLWWFYDC